MTRPTTQIIVRPKPAPALTRLVFVMLAACSSSTSTLPGDELTAGIWGGRFAGAIVEATGVHVHIDCTKGDFPAPIALGVDGRFSVSGSYILRAYPVEMGPSLPAQFAGVVDGNRLTMTVAVNDTVEQKLVVLGPVTVTLGQEPQMANCPICRRG
jgi:hypothetical protein